MRPLGPADALRIGRLVLALALCGGALALARHEGGGAAAPRPLPKAAGPAATVGGVTAVVADGIEVETRLVERLGEAKIEVPSFASGERRLATHWRKMQVPWTTLAPDVARYATTIALSSSGEEEKQMTSPQANGTVWTPNVKIWNMNEGAYDMRQAIFAPTPATLSFRVAIPPDATFHFSPAVVEYRDAQTGEPLAHTPRQATFAVFVDGGHGDEPVCDKTVSLDEVRGWQEATCDLSKWGGRSVELKLRTADAGDKSAVALALWGNPAILAKRQTRVPYNILWIVVDAMRPDALPSFHDDAKDERWRHAKYAPGAALLPKVPGVAPAIDALAASGARFTEAHSNAPWTRPGTLAMLAGERSTELGIGTTEWLVQEPDAQHYYTSSPPLLPLLMRDQGMVTRAFVNNFFMAGYAEVGLDMGFERVDDHRQRTKDTREIAESTIAWLKGHRDERFFAFCNFNSPHEPWEAPKRFYDRMPPSVTVGDLDARDYIAEVSKDDEAIGQIMATIDALKLRERTIVVVTADHGETLSAAHQGRLKLDDLTMRFHHAMGNYEETTRIPIVIALPGVVPASLDVTSRVRIIDIAPTLLDLEGLPPSPKMSGRSLLPLLRGVHEPDERVTLSEGRETEALLSGKWHFIERRGDAQEITRDGETTTVPYELYDLESDPGETHNLAKEHKDVVDEMLARIVAAHANVAAAGTTAATAPTAESVAGTVRFRFAGGGETHKVSGKIVVGHAIKVEPVGLAPTAFTVAADGTVDFSLDTAKDGIVGMDLVTAPEDAAKGSEMSWVLYWDDAPLADDHVFGGPFGLASPALTHGIQGPEARAAAASTHVATIDAARDTGVFVTIDAAGAGGRATTAPTLSKSGSAAAEMNQMLKQWGYAH